MIALLVNANDPTAESSVNLVWDANHQDVELPPSRAPLPPCFARWALLVAGGPLFDTQREQLVWLASGHAVPAIYHLRD